MRGKIHYRAKMLLHNRDNLINFAIVLRVVVTFMEKAVKLFFKVTNFRGDFYK